MPTLTIDGQKFTYDGKKMILQVALENGFEIPHYCYHPGLSIVASCRICLAEVASPDPKTGKLTLIPKLMPTCQTPASDGMVVTTNSPKSIANQKAVMEYLLINHPLDCPVCDQAGECHLQDYSFKYGRGESRFEEDKIKQPVKDIGPHVKLYSDRCIMCSRCVRFTREVTGTAEIGVFGRGAMEQIDVFPGKPLANELSGNVVDICPVGALLDGFAILALQLGDVKGAFENDLQFLHIRGLAKKIIGAFTDGPEAVGLLALAAEDDHLRLAFKRENLCQHGEAFLGSRGVGRQPQIQHHDRGPQRANMLERRLAVLGEVDRVIVAQRPLELRADILVVVNNQQCWLHTDSLVNGRTTRNSEPFPSSVSTSMRPACASTIIRQ